MAPIGRQTSKKSLRALGFLVFLLLPVACSSLQQYLREEGESASAASGSVLPSLENVETITAGLYVLPLDTNKRTFKLPPEGTEVSFTRDTPVPPGGVWIRLQWRQPIAWDRVKNFMVVHRKEGLPSFGAGGDELSILVHWWPPRNLWHDRDWLEKWPSVGRLFPWHIQASADKILEFPISDAYWTSKKNYRFILR